MRTLPTVLFQHFRNPRHQGRMEDPGGVGRVEGRREDSWIYLFLSLDGERVVARHEQEGDRSSTAALSLLCDLIDGLELKEVEGLTLDALGERCGLPEDFLPALVPAHEALQAALADLRGQPDPFKHDGELVCHCLHVRRGRLERAIRGRGLRTLEEVRHWTRACTGCRTCRPDVEEILAEGGSS